MRTTLRFALAAAAVVSVASPGGAQEPRPRLGIGVGLSAFDYDVWALQTGFPAAVPDSIYLPINLSPRLRLEPQFGIATLVQSSGNNPSLEISVWTIGLGIFWLVPVAEHFDVQVGGRFLRTSYTSKQKFDPPRGTESTDGADLRLVPAVGGEYALHPRFSLGAEAQIQIVTYGDRTVSTGGSIPGGTGVMTAGLLFARVYLF